MEVLCVIYAPLVSESSGTNNSKSSNFPRLSRMSVMGHTQQNTKGAPEEPKSAPAGPPNESTSISNQSPKLIRTPRNRRPPER
ncbi:unnamed protein product, partial [Nesidiocoris tenuis]